MRHDAQLDLRVIRGHQQVARRRDERLADAPALRPADGDVLQVGVGGRQPAGLRHRLVIRSMNASGALIHQLGQLVGVG